MLLRLNYSQIEIPNIFKNFFGLVAQCEKQIQKQLLSNGNNSF